jgi:hypothetical protein
MIWVALAPLLLVAFAVALVPVTLGITHDHRARNRVEHSHLFFVPPRGAPPAAEQGFKSDMEERLQRLEAVVAQALHGPDGESPSVAITGSKPGARAN